MINFGKITLLNFKERNIKELNLLNAIHLRKLSKLAFSPDAENFSSRADFLEKQYEELMEKIGDKKAWYIL